MLRPSQVSTKTLQGVLTSKKVIGMLVLLGLIFLSLFYVQHAKLSILPAFKSGLIEQKISIDGIPYDWTKRELCFVDADKGIKSGNVHITAVSSYVDNDNVYLRIDYPDWAASNTDLYVLLDIRTGGKKVVPGTNIETSHPYELLLNINRNNKHTLTDYKGNEYKFNCKINPNNFAFMELSIPKSIFEKFGFENDNNFFIQTFALDKKLSLVKDFVPNSVKDILNNTRILMTKAIASNAYAATVKLGIIHHGNQAVNNHTDVLLSENGGANGFIPILKAHFDANIPVNFHFSGSVLTGIRWGSTQTWTELGGKSYLNKVKEGVNATASNGNPLISILTSTFAQNIMPYEYQDQNKFNIKFENEVIEKHFGVTPVAAWVPERTWVNDPDVDGHSYSYRGENRVAVKDHSVANTFASCGVKAVLLDGNQHHNWFHTPDPTGQNDNCVFHKILDGSTQQPISVTGTSKYIAAMWNNRDIQDQLCNNSVSNITATMNWIAGFGDVGAMGIYGDDYEKAAGYSETWPDFLTTGYINMMWSLAGQSWIETVSVNSFLEWFGQKQDGSGTDEWPEIHIPYGTYENPVMFLSGGEYYQDWDKHADETGRCLTDPRSYRQMHDDAYDAIWEAINFTEQDWETNNLIKVARTVMAATTYEWMWHDDATNISDWDEKMISHTKNVSYYAEGAKWAYNPSAYISSFSNNTFPAINSKDVDKDNVDEYIMCNEKIMAIFEPDGGRIVGMFARDAGTGQGYVIVGNDVAQWSSNGGNWPDMTSAGIYTIDWTGADHQGALIYGEEEVKDGMLANTHTPTGNPFGDPNQYPDKVYTADLSTANTIKWKNDSNEVVKTVTLANNTDNWFSVEMHLDAPTEYQLPSPYVKQIVAQFNPVYINIIKNGKDAVETFNGEKGTDIYYGLEPTDATWTGPEMTGWLMAPSASARFVFSWNLLTGTVVAQSSADIFSFKIGGGAKPSGGEITTGNLTGKVTDSASGAVISGVTVSVTGTSKTGTTDGNGDYNITSIPAGSYTVSFSKSGYSSEYDSATITAGQTVTLNQTLTQQSVTGSITGTIKDGDGNIVSGATVKTSPTTQTTSSDASGNYTLNGIGVGNYTLLVTKSNFEDYSDSVTVVEGSTTKNVTLTAKSSNPGDPNDDNVVDGLDLILLAVAFGSSSGSSNWNSACDFNNDGVIDGLDLIVLAVNFGNSYA